MAITIDQESKVTSSLLIDLDNYRDTYVTKEIDTLDESELVIEFVSPFLKVYEKYRFYLLQNSVKKNISPKNFYRPDYVSYEEYGTTVLWTMLLFINNILNIEEFTKDIILVPNKSIINEIGKHVITEHEIINLESGINEPTFQYERLYSVIDQPTLQEPVKQIISTQDEKDYYFVRQLFPVRTVTASKKFIDLKYPAVPESINFRIKDQPSFIYGLNYTIIMKDGFMSRLVWGKEYVDEGMEDIIQEGMIIEVQYAHETK